MLFVHRIRSGLAFILKMKKQQPNKRWRRFPFLRRFCFLLPVVVCEWHASVDNIFMFYKHTKSNSNSKSNCSFIVVSAGSFFRFVCFQRINQRCCKSTTIDLYRQWAPERESERQGRGKRTTNKHGQYLHKNLHYNQECNKSKRNIAKKKKKTETQTEPFSSFLHERRKNNNWMS